MASAIKDFINDWIQNSDDPSEVQLVSYGNATLYIESAGSVYLIAFMDAEPDQEQRTKINRFFASLLKEYMTFFQTFDGDDSAEEIVSLKQEMQHYLNAQHTNPGKEKKKSKYMQFVALAVGILLFAGTAEWAKEIFDEYQIKKEVFEQSGYEIGIDINDQTVTVTGSVDTFADFEKIKKAIKEKSGLKIVDRITMPLMQINKMILDEKKSLEQALTGLQEHIAVLEKNIKGSKRIIIGLEQNVQESNRSIEELSNTVRILQNKIEKAEQERTLRLKMIDRLMHLKNDLDRVFAEKFKKSPYFNPAVHEFVFSDNTFFEKGKTLLDNDAQKIIAVNVNKYINTLMAIPEAKKYLKKIFVKGHTDSDGNIGYNKRLSKERAKNVEKFIANMDIVKQNRLGSLLDSKGFASQFPLLKNGMEDKNASRRIEIEFQFDDKRLENDIASLLTAVDKQ
jgi:outer membrane protein OmpA-like peptidoglycan-associated protein